VTEVLFTPWRLAYLSGEAQSADGCLFCDLARRGDEEALVVHRARSAFVLLNRFPYTNGHLMVAPYAHHATLASLPPDERTELIELGALCEGVLRETYRPHGFNLGINLGKSAGAGVADHLHLHVVPRWDGDTNFLTVLAGTRTVPEELTRTRARLAPLFAEAAARDAVPGGGGRGGGA
jgi:ATP adenylyltransferase